MSATTATVRTALVGMWLGAAFFGAIDCASEANEGPVSGAGPEGGETDGTGGSGDGGRGDGGTVRESGSMSPGDAGAPDAVPDVEGGESRDSSGSGASTDGGGALCPELGFCELTNTQLRSVCPDENAYAAIQANEGCGAVINDWSGGVGDTKGNRLLIWGGGHRGYFGNEVYALDLKSVVMRRLNDPSDISGIDLTDCNSKEAYADGRPSSRHTYDGLAYIPEANKMFAIAGAGIPCGYGVKDTWTLDLATVESAPPGQAAPWMDMLPTPAPAMPNYGVVSDYDPNSKKVILDDGKNLWSYDLGSNSYALLNDANATDAHVDYHMTGRVDPKRKLFVIMGGTADAGGGVQVFDISAGSSYAQQNWTNQVSGCDGLIAAPSPGLAYDPVLDRLVGWAGGDTVYLFDPDAKACTKLSYGGGPGEQNANGTFGRFRYFPDLDVFAIVNDPQKNAYTLRLAP